MESKEWPVPGSAEEIDAYNRLRSQVAELYKMLSADPRTPQTVVVIPSLSMDRRELQKISGVWHYEERMLVNLMLLKQPRTRLIYVTSQQIDPMVVDYYLSLLPGVPSSHARSRLVMLNCGDSSAIPLSQKVLNRPRLMRRIHTEIRDYSRAHMVCFNSTALERTLSVRLNLPLHSVDPQLSDLGTKSGCREVFRAAGVQFPFGFLFFEQICVADGEIIWLRHMRRFRARRSMVFPAASRSTVYRDSRDHREVELCSVVVCTTASRACRGTLQSRQ